MFHGTIITLKNVSDEEIVDRYDDREYRFPAGKTVKLPEETARFFQGRHVRALEVAKVSRGRDAQGPVVSLVNTTDDTLSATYDGVPYVFEPGKPLEVPKELVAWFSDVPHLSGNLDVVQPKAPKTKAPAKPKTSKARTPKTSDSQGSDQAPSN